MSFTPPPAGGIISNTQLGNFVVDGAYVAPSGGPPPVSVGPQTNLCVVVGAANWGPKNVLTPFDSNSIFSVFGNLTANVYSLVRGALTMMPEATNFSGIRVTDGNDTPATLKLNDSTSTAVLTGTAVYTGSYPNKQAYIRADLQSGTLTNNPVFTITVGFPGSNPLVYPNIVGYATLGSGYAQATFIANALAALNGTAPNSTPNPWFVFSAGTSANAPQTGTPFFASGGTDGASNIKSTTLVGTDGQVGRTGMYAARGGVAMGQIVLVGLSDVSQFQNLATFCMQESCIGFLSMPSGNTAQSAVAAKVGASASNDFVVTTCFWDYVQDQISGQKLLVDPSCKIAGIIAAQPTYMYVGNKPRGGAVGVISTERSVLGPISQGEQALLQQNNLLYLTNQMPRGGGLWGLPFGSASSGAAINDVRMRNFIAISVLNILGPFVGEMQTAKPSDPTRAQMKAALTAFLQSLMNPANSSNAAIADFEVDDTTLGSPTNIPNGYALFTVNVTTLSGIKFAIAFVNVGGTVQIQTASQQ